MSPSGASSGAAATHPQSFCAGFVGATLALATSIMINHWLRLAARFIAGWSGGVWNAYARWESRAFPNGDGI